MVRMVIIGWVGDEHIRLELDEEVLQRLLGGIAALQQSVGKAQPKGLTRADKAGTLLKFAFARSYQFFDR